MKQDEFSSNFFLVKAVDVCNTSAMERIKKGCPKAWTAL